jgi:hypothetical protein
MHKHTIALLISVLPCAGGCVGVSMHSPHRTLVTVTHLADGAPASAVPVAVSYDYDSYGMFYFANTPGPETGLTDDQGHVSMSLADFRYRIILRIDGAMTTIDRATVIEGGAVTLSDYRVRLEPQ